MLWNRLTHILKDALKREIIVYMESDGEKKNRRKRYKICANEVRENTTKCQNQLMRIKGQFFFLTSMSIIMKQSK